MASTVAGILLTGTHAARPTSGVSVGTLYACTTHPLIYQTSDTGSTWGTWAAAGSSTTTIANDTIWAAAGDIAVATGNDAAAVVGIGAVGAHLSRLNGTVQWNSGTSNPTGAAGDRYWRSDLGLEIYYDGTRWLTTTLYQLPINPADAVTPFSATGTNNRVALPLLSTYTPRIVDYWAGFFVSGGTALGASHKWVCELKNAVSGTVLGTININSGASNAWRSSGAVSVATNVAITEFELEVLSTKTGTPGTLYLLPMISYRLVIT